MQKRYQKLSQNYHWQADTPLSQNRLPNPLMELMTDKGSLTSALVAISGGTFCVKVLSEQVKAPYLHEQTKLNRMHYHAAMIREVELQIYDQTVVYARSIIPLSLLSKGLIHLGNKPLGHLLFKDGRMRVSKRQFANIDDQKRTIHARRSPYEYMGQTILVSEFFLPTLDQYFS